MSDIKMAISPTSLSNSASFLQDVRGTQANSVRESVGQANQSKKNDFKHAVELQQDNKSSSVAAQIQTTNSSKLGQGIDIKIDDEDRQDRKQLDLTQSIQREAPLANSSQNRAPGSILDISV